MATGHRPARRLADTPVKQRVGRGFRQVSVRCFALRRVASRVASLAATHQSAMLHVHVRVRVRVRVRDCPRTPTSMCGVEFELCV